MFSTTKWNWKRISVATLFLVALIAGISSHSWAATAKVLTKKEVKALIATAKTPEEHMKLGDVLGIAGYSLSLEKLEDIKAENYSAKQATLQVYDAIGQLVIQQKM